MKRPRILLLSSILPAETFGGPVLLHRHLVDRDDFELLEIGTAEIQAVKEWRPVETIANRLSKTRFSHHVRHYEQIFKYRRLNHELKRRIETFQPQVVLTVAHGSLFWLAKKVAKQLELPLVSIFHDWWPYLVTRHAGVSEKTAKVVEERFRELYRQSDCVMPVCNGMQKELGAHLNSVTILPIPPRYTPAVNPNQGRESVGKIVYLGNMSSGYGRMIRDFIDNSNETYDDIRCFGNSSDWPNDYREKCIEAGLLSDGFVPEAELSPCLSSALALLVTLPMNQDPPIARRTSFPSKLSSYLKYERPIVFWGSPDSSLISWARDNHASAVFVEEDPKNLVAFLQELKGDMGLQEQLCEEARNFKSVLDPDKIHKQFRDAIFELVA